MKRALILALLAVSAPAFAQQAPTQQQPPEVRALAGRLEEELGTELQWRAQALALQEKLAAAEKENADLKAELAKLKEGKK